MDRRLFLKSALVSGVALSAVAGGLLAPSVLFAASDDFKVASDAVAKKIASASPGDFKFKTPKIAENGAVVPLTVDASKMKEVSEIAIYVKNNATPLASVFKFSNNSLGFASTRVKMAKTSEVVALVVASGKSYTISKEVKVTVGGCGG